VTVAQQTSTIS